MSEPPSRPPRLSEIVKSIDTGQQHSIGAIIDKLGERAFGALIFVFAAPNIFPTPPGTSAVLGLPLVLLGFQLMIGRQTVWLPETIRRRSISGAVIGRSAARIVAVLARIERILRPRLSLFVLSNLAEKLIGLVIFTLAIILFLPIPLVNIFPAAAIAALALALAERDGVAVMIGYAFAIATAVLLGFVSSALYAAARTFFHSLFGN